MNAQLPSLPYPGLRPFFDFEAALLFGRERQTREIIDRLRDTQFVAVLGGSGSGKSSLIKAGVVPELRSFGIPGAGDLWLPLVCTPGSNASATAAPRDTPIARLARKFSNLLKSRGSPEADETRLGEIASVFRQEAGFARLIDTYTGELMVPPGPDAQDARLLIVVDQFEEIFHPANRGVDDAQLLVERVIDHFFNPHPRCYVVLTLRSEFLNDCAAFLELPDAINRSSYLVRRMDGDELREVIVGPAQRFLRLLVRSDAAGAAPPAEVAFEPAMLDRVQRDTLAITHDPDHLPLLQHLLARWWQAALAREAAPVPARLTEQDLVRAVGQPLDEHTNTLRACLEYWPEANHQALDAAQRAALDQVLDGLGMKDPNSGQYSQQRIDVDVAALAGAQRQRRDDLRRLIGPGFLAAPAYLFWDDEDPARVTLKVSHESFIRGWSRLRRRVDRESERFAEFVGVLRLCAAWDAGGRDDALLLADGELRRLRDSGFEGQCSEPMRRQGWLRLLQLDRDGAALSQAEPALDTFLATSNRRWRERERRASRTRRSWLVALVVMLVLLPTTMFSVLIQGPVTKRALWLFEAGSVAQNTPRPAAFVDAGEQQSSLRSLLQSAALVDRAVVGDGPLSRISQWLLVELDFIAAVRRQTQLFDGVRAMVEPSVNGQLRALMTSTLWDAEISTSADETVRGQSAARSCYPGGGVLRFPISGQLLTEAGGAGRGEHLRHLFVARGAPGFEDSLAIFMATDDGSGGCRAGDLVKSIPMFIDPYVVFDPNLRYFIASQSSDSDDSASATLYEIEWSGGRVQAARDRAVLANKEAVARVRAAAGSGRVGIVPTWRKPNGWAFDVGGRPWRVASARAQPISDAAVDRQFVPLAAAPDGSWCAEVGKRSSRDQPPEFWTTAYARGQECFVVTRGRPPGDAGNERLDEVIVAVYRQPGWGNETLQRAQLDQVLPSPLASLPQFARLPVGVEGAWHAGVDGPHAGWLAWSGRDADGDARLLGAPWSTCALWRQGQDFLPPADRAAADLGICQGR